MVARLEQREHRRVHRRHAGGGGEAGLSALIGRERSSNIATVGLP